jgi:sugar lactone lactonase YvrE
MHTIPAHMLTQACRSPSVQERWVVRARLHSDSRQSTIWRYDYDSTDGVPSNKRIFAVLRPDQGRPDGATVDAEGFYWSCCYAGGRLIRFSPDGTIDREISMPAKNVTMCAFGGSNFDTLYVTTASEHMNEEERRQYPLAGGIFAMDVGVRGLPETNFSG